MFKNYDIYYVGQGDGDHLGTISIDESLFNRHQVHGNIVIGGGHNGQYMLTGTGTKSGFWCVCDQIGDLTELVKTIQDKMGHDSGSYISHKFLKGLKETATYREYYEVLRSLKYKVQDYSGGPEVKVSCLQPWD